WKEVKGHTFDENFEQKLCSLLFFRFLVGFAINAHSIGVVQSNGKLIPQSLHEGRLDQSKRSLGISLGGQNWIVFGSKCPLEEDQSQFSDQILIDAQIEIQRILGCLKRMVFER